MECFQSAFQGGLLRRLGGRGTPKAVVLGSLFPERSLRVRTRRAEMARCVASWLVMALVGLSTAAAQQPDREYRGPADRGAADRGPAGRPPMRSRVGAAAEPSRPSQPAEPGSAAPSAGRPRAAALQVEPLPVVPSKLGAGQHQRVVVRLSNAPASDLGGDASPASVVRGKAFAGEGRALDRDRARADHQQPGARWSLGGDCRGSQAGGRAGSGQTDGSRGSGADRGAGR